MVMFPTHVAIGYLLGRTTHVPMGALLLGSMLPDLIDRPLAWLGVMAHAHTIGHSALLALPVGLVLTLRYGPQGLAVTMAWVLHIGADVFNALTSQGPAPAPYFALYPLDIPPSEVTDASVQIAVPLVDIGHAVHPIVLLVEVVLVLGALGAAILERGDHRVRWPIRHTDR